MKVAVIGAGILGASTALHLIKAGAEVEIFDRAHDGKATMAGAGIVCPWSSKYENPARYALSHAGACYYPDLVAELHERGIAETGYRRVGALVAASDLDEAERRIRARAEPSPRAGTVTRLEGRQARELFPVLAGDRGAIHISGGARVDARIFSAAMLEAARRAGAKQHHEEVSLKLKGHRAVCISPSQGEVAADMTVLTAGAWASDVLKALNLPLPVEPQRGQILHLRLPGIDTSRWPVVSTLSDNYMLAFDDSRVAIGATREFGVGFDYRVTAGGQAELLGAAFRIAPDLASASVIETRIGFRPFVHNLTPILTQAPGIDGLVIGNGLGAGGLTIGPYSGKLLAEIALGQKPELDIAPYALPS